MNPTIVQNLPNFIFLFLLSIQLGSNDELGTMCSLLTQPLIHDLCSVALARGRRGGGH